MYVSADCVTTKEEMGLFLLSLGNKKLHLPTERKQSLLVIFAIAEICGPLPSTTEGG
jgi:hypothetical protein